MIEQCVALLGKERIGMIVADREFVGHTWLAYLKQAGILFCIRMPKHHLITRLDGRVQAAHDLVEAGKALCILV